MKKSPPGWTQPGGLSGPPVLDPDIAAGLEFLVKLEKRLVVIERQLKALDRQLKANQEVCLKMSRRCG